MKIFIDTNIFYNDWFMRNANFKYLFHFLNNESHSLILSKLVVQESENIRERELSSSLSDIKASLKKIQKLNFNNINFSEDSLGVDDYDLLCLIKSRVETVQEFCYDKISHSEVVSRALEKKKPFLEGEKGYRDTLIWLSFLDFLIQNDITEDVAFISNNKSDFFSIVDSNVNFHSDLVADIEKKGVKANIVPFNSLFSFIQSRVDKDTHAIDHFSCEEIFENFLESSSISFIEEMSNKQLGELFGSAIFETKVKDILEIRAEIMEGIEDPFVTATKQMEGGDIYVGYSYNLRRFVIEVDIPEIDYALNKDDLDRVFYQSESNSGVVTLTSYNRPYFDVSFIYNDKTEELKDFVVDGLWFT